LVGCDLAGAPGRPAALTCQRRSQRGYRYFVAGFRLNADGARASAFPDLTPTECVYPEKVVPASDVQALAAQHLRKLVGRPTITTAPTGGRTLVNIPTLYSTTRYDPVTLDVHTPVPGQLRAVPEYAWDFTGGTDHDHALGPGTPYQPGINPLTHPDHYLHTTYRTTGDKTAHLTLTWAVTFTLDGTLDVDLAPNPFTTPTTTPAVAARNELITRPATR
jgi:hypothetical protein